MRRRDVGWIAVAVTAHFSAVAAATWGVSMARLAEEPPPQSPEPALALSDDERGRADGEREARADLARGILGWRTYTVGGGFHSSIEPYQKVSMYDVLADDFGVVIRAEGGRTGCILPPDLEYQRARLDAYNAVMRPALEKRHGKDVLSVALGRANAENTKRRLKHEEAERERKKRGEPDGRTAGWLPSPP